jgi:hypothetical protein
VSLLFTLLFASVVWAQAPPTTIVPTVVPSAIPTVGAPYYHRSLPGQPAPTSMPTPAK